MTARSEIPALDASEAAPVPDEDETAAAAESSERAQSERAQSERPKTDGAKTDRAETDRAETDEALLLAVAETRDKAAFVELFRRYAGRVKAFLVGSGAAADVADEAAQEAMLSVWRRADSYDPGRASAAAWIFAIARNKRIDLLRKASRPQVDPEDPLYAPDPPKPADAIYAADARDRAVRAALGALTPEQRDVVTMSFYQGRAHSEIAEALDLPLGTVKSRLRLAFGKLKERLGDAFRAELDDA